MSKTTVSKNGKVKHVQRKKKDEHLENDYVRWYGEASNHDECLDYKTDYCSHKYGL